MDSDILCDGRGIQNDHVQLEELINSAEKFELINLKMSDFFWKKVSFTYFHGDQITVNVDQQLYVIILAYLRVKNMIFG